MRGRCMMGVTGLVVRDARRINKAYASLLELCDLLGCKAQEAKLKEVFDAVDESIEVIAVKAYYYDSCE